MMNGIEMHSPTESPSTKILTVTVAWIHIPATDWTLYEDYMRIIWGLYRFVLPIKKMLQHAPNSPHNVLDGVWQSSQRIGRCLTVRTGCWQYLTVRTGCWTVPDSPSVQVVGQCLTFFIGCWTVPDTSHRLLGRSWQLVIYSLGYVEWGSAGCHKS